MPTSRLRRHAALLCITAAGVTAAAPAQAQLGGLIPNVGTITGAGQTLGNVVPVGGVVTGVTGTVGGAVMGVQDPVTGTVDSALGDVLGGAGGLLPQDTLGVLLATLLGGSGSGGAGGPAGGRGGPIVLSGGQVGPGGVIVDASAPRPAVRVLSRLRSIGRTGRMRIEVRTNEPGIVALAGAVRPGRAARSARRGLRSSTVAHSRRVIKVPSIVLGYRRAGRLTVTVKLSRSAQRTLGRSRNARLSAGTVAADLFRNQSSDRAKLTIRR